MTQKILSSALWLVFYCLSTIVHATPVMQQRQDFLAAESAIQRGDALAFTQLTSSLSDYPLLPYLQYQWLTEHLTDLTQINAFLQQYADTRYAPLLRAKWLTELAKQQRWQEFLQFYSADTDNIGLQCQFYWAAYQTGNVSVLAQAQTVLQKNDDLPKACDDILTALIPSLPPEQVWNYFVAALEKDNVSVAAQISSLMNKEQKSVASVWLQVHKKPTTVMQTQFSQTAKLFAHGVKRLAKSDINGAIALWDNQKQSVNADNETAQAVERQLGLKLAHERDSRAFERLSLVLNPDEEVREWKVRSALLSLNWQQVNTALNGLTAEERKQPKWQYWQARALTELGDNAGANAIWAILANDRSFYGFAAADVLNRPYALSNKPISVNETYLMMLANQPDFKVVQEWRALNRELEAKRQWTYAIKKLSKEQLLLAAKLAQYWQWHPVAIVTLKEADYWDDLSVRFPISYTEQVTHNAQVQDIQPAVIFGLMRQESMLDENAQSPAGAKGLMQIMPETGKHIAAKLHETWQGNDSLFNPIVNIEYGTFYYRQLLDRFNGNFALATAAYNAGPQRVDKWLANRSMPVDVWIETIPFKETRKYVTSVFSYTLIYNQLLQHNTLKTTNLLTDLPSS